MDKFLPIGTVLMLKDGYKRLMITGYKCTSNNKTYDYSGCLYPEGIITSDKALLFNHDQIMQVYHTGFINDDFKKLNESLKK